MRTTEDILAEIDVISADINEQLSLQHESFLKATSGGTVPLPDSELSCLDPTFIVHLVAKQEALFEEIWAKPEYADIFKAA